MDEILVKISDPIILDKKTTVSVPMNHRAYLVINQKVVAQLRPGDNQKIKKLDKKLLHDHRGESVNLILVVGDTSAVRGGFGFGPVIVNNRNTGERYEVSANGYFTIDINEPLKLVKEIPGESQITLFKIQESISGIIGSVGSQLLAEYLSSIDKSKYDIATCTSEFSSILFDALNRHKDIADPNRNKDIADYGISFASLGVNEFFAW